MIGQRLGPYEIIDILSSEGMAVGTELDYEETLAQIREELEEDDV